MVSFTTAFTLQSGLVGDVNGTQALRIAQLCETFGVNCFPSGQDGSAAGGTNSAASYVIGLSYICGSSGLGMFNRIYANNTTLDEPFIQTICQGVPHTRFTSCISYDPATVAVVQNEAGSPQANAGYLVAVEGYNEPDNAGVQSNQLPVPVATCLTAQQNIYGSAQTYGLTVMLPSITDTSNTYETDYMGSNLSAFQQASNWSNGHDYPNSGAPNHDLARRSDYLVTTTGKPCAITEFHPLMYNNTAAKALGDLGAAYYTLIALLSGVVDHALKGLIWFSFYDYPSAGFPYHAGLFNGWDPTTPTQTAMAMRALFQLTGDTGGSQRLNFAPGKLQYSFNPALPAPASFSPLSGGRSALFQNSAGQFFLIIWNEQDTPGGTTQSITVTFSGPRQRVRVYDLTTNPTTAMTAVSDQANVSSVAVNLNAGVRLLVIDYGSSANTNLLFADEFNTLQLYNPQNPGAGGTWMPGGPNATTSMGSTDTSFDSWLGSGFNPATPNLNTLLYSVSNSILRVNFIATPAAYSAACSNKPWCSGTLNTSDTFSHQYGYVEVRARMPAGAVPGIGGSFWLLAAPDGNPWPPEMDFNEWGGISGGTNQYHGASFETGPTITIEAPFTDDVQGTSTTTWSTYAMDWQADTTTFYWNGIVTASGPTPTAAKRPCHMIIQMNAGTAGQWGNGPVTNAGLVPTYIEVDYFRWYAHKP